MLLIVVNVKSQLSNSLAKVVVGGGRKKRVVQSVKYSSTRESLYAVKT